MEAIGNPWITVWTRPRATIRRIVEIDVHYQVLFLAMLAGALSRLEARWAQPPGTPGSAAFPLIVVLSVIGGAIAGLIGLYINGALLKWSGTILGGIATYAEVRAALAWAEVPVIVAVSIGILSILIGTGGPMMPFVGNGAESSVSVSLLHAVFGLWSFILVLKCVGEVHRFSAWRALGAIVLIAVAIAILIVIALLLAGGIGHLMRPAITV
jgi:hypothetical protein